MYKFDTRVQELRYMVIKAIAKRAFNNELNEKTVLDIPKEIIPGPKSTMRCCIYKERAIVEERIKIACSHVDSKQNVIRVIDIACDECPLGGYTVTNSCRGCIAHRCEKACFKHAISFDPLTRQAIIDKEKCVNCGMCAKACQYHAIENRIRPCEAACKVKAISPSENGAAHIDDSKCIQCGACVYMCPFGAVVDESYVLDIIDMLKKAKENKTKVYAVVAPSISSQFYYAKLGQIVTALKTVGFQDVIEAALGADMVAYKEAKELKEKKTLTSSCCPAFVAYIQKNFPTLVDKISHNFSPMAEISKYLKSIDPTCKVVFIGPCTAKKNEIKTDKVRGIVDAVMTFEEVSAFIDAKIDDVTKLELTPLDNASYFGRIFARSGGLSDAVVQALKEQNDEFEAKAVICSGIDECKLALNKMKNGKLEENFIEGMACIGGCIGGPCCLTHEVRDKNEVDKYGKEAIEKTITSAISAIEEIKK